MSDERKPDIVYPFFCGCQRVGFKIYHGIVPTFIGKYFYLWQTVCATHEATIPANHRVR